MELPALTTITSRTHIVQLILHSLLSAVEPYAIDNRLPFARNPGPHILDRYLVFHILGALTEFERDLIRERTLAGLAAARARGRKGGRPGKLDAKKTATATRLLDDPNQSITEVAQILGVARSTLYRAFKTNKAGR